MSLFKRFRLLVLLAAMMAVMVVKASQGYGDALTKSILFFEGQRSGKLPSSQRMTWRKDSALHDGFQIGLPWGEVKAEAESAAAKSRGGGGGWGFSSVFTDLQKAAEEISLNAATAAQTAAKSIADMQIAAEDSEESSKKEERDTEKESEDENEKQRKVALKRLEKASEESFLSQHLKVLDSSVENFASGAWQALGSAFRGGTGLVHKLENSAVNLAGTIQRDVAGSVAPSSLLEWLVAVI